MAPETEGVRGCDPEPSVPRPLSVEIRRIAHPPHQWNHAHMEFRIVLITAYFSLCPLSKQNNTFFLWTQATKTMLTKTKSDLGSKNAKVFFFWGGGIHLNLQRLVFQQTTRPLVWDELPRTDGWRARSEAVFNNFFLHPHWLTARHGEHVLQGAFVYDELHPNDIHELISNGSRHERKPSGSSASEKLHHVYKSFISRQEN